jgi:hypothetical protein
MYKGQTNRRRKAREKNNGKEILYSHSELFFSDGTARRIDRAMPARTPTHEHNHTKRKNQISQVVQCFVDRAGKKLSSSLVWDRLVIELFINRSSR